MPTDVSNTNTQQTPVNDILGKYKNSLINASTALALPVAGVAGFGALSAVPSFNSLSRPGLNLPKGTPSGEHFGRLDLGTGKVNINRDLPKKLDTRAFVDEMKRVHKGLSGQLGRNLPNTELVISPTNAGASMRSFPATNLMSLPERSHYINLGSSPVMRSPGVFAHELGHALNREMHPTALELDKFNIGDKKARIARITDKLRNRAMNGKISPQDLNRHEARVYRYSDALKSDPKYLSAIKNYNHALDSFQARYGLGKLLSGGGTLGAAFGNEPIARYSAILGALGGLGYLPEEIKASVRGYNTPYFQDYLKETGKKLQGGGNLFRRQLIKAGPFVGLPTYAAAAGAAPAAYGIRRALGMFDKDLGELKQ